MEDAAARQRHGQTCRLDACDVDDAAAAELQRPECRHVDVDAHRTFRREAAGGVPDHEVARLHLGRDAAEQVVVRVYDDGLLAADADADVVAPGQLDALERRQLPRLRRRHAGALNSVRARRSREDVVPEQQQECDPEQQDDDEERSQRQLVAMRRTLMVWCRDDSHGPSLLVSCE